MATFDVGDQLDLWDEVRTRQSYDPATHEATYALTDPASLTCTVTLPDGTTSTPTATMSQTGVWLASFTITQSGEHRVRFNTPSGTGTGTGATTFDVRRP